jgi:hypothetical protein
MVLSDTLGKNGQRVVGWIIAKPIWLFRGWLLPRDERYRGGPDGPIGPLLIQGFTLAEKNILLIHYQHRKGISCV